VFEIMVHYVANGDWKAAFNAIIPERKLSSAVEVTTEIDGQEEEDAIDGLEEEIDEQLEEIDG
jgi:hypothetical protein